MSLPLSDGGSASSVFRVESDIATLSRAHAVCPYLKQSGMVIIEAALEMNWP